MDTRSQELLTENAEHETARHEIAGQKRLHYNSVCNFFRTKLPFCMTLQQGVRRKPGKPSLRMKQILYGRAVEALISLTHALTR